MKLTVIALLLLVPAAFAQLERVEINATINTDSSVQHTVQYYFSTPLNASLVNYTLSRDVRDILVYSNDSSLGYQFAGNAIQILLERPVSTLTISYIADNVVFRSGSSVYDFLTEFNFDEIIEQLDVNVALPPGYTLYENFYRPSTGDVVTDGTRIIVQWTEAGAEGRYLFAVKFMNPSERGNPLVFVVIVLVIIIGSGAYYGYTHFRRSVSEAFFKGFRDDEKRTIEFIQTKKMALQSDLQKQFGFSRAKATRIIMKLEEKKLVRKQKYGRTNKVHWTG